MASLPLTRLGEVVMVAVVAAGESSRFRFALRPRRDIDEISEGRDENLQ